MTKKTPLTYETTCTIFELSVKNNYSEPLLQLRLAQLINKLIDKFHKNDYHYRFADNRSFDFCVCYFTVFTLSIQTPHDTLSKI